MNEEDLKIYPDGSIRNGYDYVYWAPGDKEACLDGYFTIEDLEKITKHMKEHSGG